eukprot:gnl/MRDRNA2_/MRDRNA2_72638_c0_seq2.p1 gnl/MRDRNA2_/MRDRNA2_72638_c0~~gnl/MRDRNA2_/MRDRNA2_72638_c0_seq2.p1  ORF type:complete len:1439 (+),score=238.57 gnl/MRDRNA2_/MRDRNA2_72638_c0_seq2:397-4317(+)
MSVFGDEVEKASTAGNRLYLDWWKDLRSARAGHNGTFTSVNDLNIEWGAYQYCDHGDADRFQEWGWTCNASLEYDNPWRDANGQWPTTLKPFYTCEEWETIGSKAVPKEYRKHGFECISDGWWASEACLALGDPLNTCIPFLSYDVLSEDKFLRSFVKLGIPIITTKTSNWEVHEEMLYDYSVNQNNVLLLWWDPDASAALHYGMKLNSVSLGQDQALPSVLLKKVTWFPLKKLDFAVYKFAKQFTMDTVQMRQMLADVVQKVDDKKEEDYYYAYYYHNKAKDIIACEWVKNNEETWSQWFLQPSDCPEGTYFADSMNVRMCEDCPAGTAAKTGVANIDECVPCQPGYFSTPGSSSCSPCQAGSFQNEMGAFDCNDCPAGRFSVDAAAVCEPCAAGRFVSKPKSSTCDICAPGTFQNRTGAAECEQCDIGRYANQPGMLQCTECGQSFVTARQGRTSESHCLCDKGMYFTNTSGCRECTEGLICQQTFGRDTPRLESGYMSLLDDPTSVYRCIYPRGCEGVRDPFADNATTTCTNGHAGMACGRCAEGNILQGTKCVPCNAPGGGMTSRITKRFGDIVYGGCLLTVTTTYLFYKSKLPTTAEALIQGLLINFVQACSVINQFQIEWPSFLSRVMSAGAIFESLPDMVNMKTDCFLQQSSFKERFLAEMLWPFWLQVAFVLVWAFWKGMYIFREGGHGRFHRLMHRFVPKVAIAVVEEKLAWFWPMDSADMLNAMQSAHFGLFISILSLSFSLFDCQTHPNGVPTLAKFQDVQCEGTDWQEALPIGISSVLIYCAGFISWVFYLIWRAPYCIGTDPKFSHKYRFIMCQWHPGRYWFSSVTLCLAVMFNVTATFVKNSYMQVHITSVLLVVYMSIVNNLTPWRFAQNDVVDVCMKFTLVLITMIASVYIEQSEEALQETRDAFKYLISVLPFLPMLLAVFLYLRVMRTKYLAQSEFMTTQMSEAQRFRDVTSMACHMSNRELNKLFTYDLCDDDRSGLKNAVDILVATVLKMQPSSALHKRRVIMAEYEVADIRKIEDAIEARGITSPALVERRLLHRIVNYLDMRESQNTTKFLKKQLHAITGRGKSRYRAAFNAMDCSTGSLGGAHNLTQDEFVGALRRQLGLMPENSVFTEEELRTIFDIIDLDGSGTVSMDEFCAVLDLVDQCRPNMEVSERSSDRKTRKTSKEVSPAADQQHEQSKIKQDGQNGEGCRNGEKSFEAASSADQFYDQEENAQLSSTSDDNVEEELSDIALNGLLSWVEEESSDERFRRYAKFQDRNVKIPQEGNIDDNDVQITLPEAAKLRTFL